MNELRFTLLSDGSSDRALIPILKWLLIDNNVTLAIQPAWADLRILPRPPRTLPDRIRASLRLHPCDLLFVHRDAERLPLERRRHEIVTALNEACPNYEPPAVCVVPVRMMEAWLLFHEGAIREASGNPAGQERLALPAIRRIESLPNPKRVLHDLVRQASGLTARRRKDLPADRAVHRIAEIIGDFSPLRELPAFRSLEEGLRGVLDSRA